jgi:nucleoside-diphosphate-sugar epimerase
MILITGGTGFIGQVLISRLLAMGKPVRLLLRPRPESPAIPRGIPLEIAVSSLGDERSLRAAMKNVDVIYHLAGDENRSTRSNLGNVDIEGTKMIAQIAVQSGVRHLIYLSHLGADSFSAFAVLRAKAIGENAIMRSGINFTIFRSAVVYGRNDHFTTPIARLLRRSPFFLLPGEGNSLIQPIWVGDLVACLAWVLEDKQMVNQTISIGGSEYIPFRQTIEAILVAMKKKRFLFSLPPTYLRTFSLLLLQVVPLFPLSIFWLDYLAADRTCSLDTLPRLFGIMPARFSHQIDYLQK